MLLTSHQSLSVPCPSHDVRAHGEARLYARGRLSIMADSSVGSAEFADALVRVGQTILRVINTYDRTRDPSDLDLLVYQVSKLYRILACTLCDSYILRTIGTALNHLERCEMEVQVSSENRSYTPEVLDTGRRGRPQLHIPKEHIEYLLHMNFSCPRIALLVGVSLSTIRRRMCAYSLSVSDSYSDVTDPELDLLVRDIKHNNPNAGYRLMQGHLLQQGYRIAQARIRDSMRRVDPDGVAIRWAATVQRRKYSVASPLSLWHIDGNHKLIRYTTILIRVRDKYWSALCMLLIFVCIIIYPSKLQSAMSLFCNVYALIAVFIM